jgi:hypothetical protein
LKLNWQNRVMPHIVLATILDHPLYIMFEGEHWHLYTNPCGATKWPSREAARRLTISERQGR